MKRNIGFSGFLVIVICFLGCGPAREGSVTLIHTNDIHGQYRPVKAFWVDGDRKPLIGGMVALNGTIERLRNRYDPVLVLDGGDFMTGTPLTRMEYNGAVGGGIVALMNQIGYDALTIGNHEFDDGVDNLRSLIDMFEADVLCANLNVDGVPFAPAAFKIYTAGTLRVGVIGLLMADLGDVVAADRMQRVEVQDPVSITRDLVSRIDDKTDVIVLLTHQGIESDVNLAHQLQDVDVIVGSHSHTRLTKPQMENRILIVQAGSKTTNVGRLTLDIGDDKVKSYEYDLIPTWVDSVQMTDSVMTRLVDQFKEQIDREYGRQIGVLHTDWQRDSNGESNLGNFLTDVLRKTTRADFAVLNSGGIRKNLKAGPVTKRDVVEILPFTNMIQTFQCTGEQLWTLARNNAKAAITGEHGVLQVSGLTYIFKGHTKETVEVLDVIIQGKPVDPDEHYTGASVDFVLEGHAKHYLGFEPDATTETGRDIATEVTSYIQTHPQIRSRVEGRIKRVQ